MLLAGSMSAGAQTFNFQTNSGTGSGWTWVGQSGNTLVMKLTITANGTYTITAPDSNSGYLFQRHIIVNDGVTANIVLDGVHIGAFDGQSPLSLLGNANVTLTLTNSNTLAGGPYAPAISVPKASSKTATLTINGGGTLLATGGVGAAGIGGAINVVGVGNINITGGTITAIGGNAGAGIGGGQEGNSGTISISGGNVTAAGGRYGAGIGAGSAGYAETITISGSAVVIATGEKYAPGIGDGIYNETNTVGTINITGGTITSTGGEYSPGIGFCIPNTGDAVNISGGNINATGGDMAPGIGGGTTVSANGLTVNISGGNVTATATAITSGGKAAGIGGGHNAPTTGTIRITGGSVKAISAGGAVAPQFTNGSVNVYLNTLTVGSSSVANIAVTAGKIGTANCVATSHATCLWYQRRKNGCSRKGIFLSTGK
jgi:hypothetical protein